MTDASTGRKPNILYVHLLSTPLDNILASFEGKNLVIQEIVMPLGLMYVSSYARLHGAVGTAGLLDFPVYADRLGSYKDLDDFVLTLARGKVPFVPDILAFSLNLSTSHHFFIRSSRLLRTLWPSAVTVVGGVHATSYAATYLRNGDADYVVTGEGEIGFAELTRRIFRTPRPEIPGVCHKASTSFDPGPMVMDLDRIPFPDWDLIDMEYYVSHITRVPKRDSSNVHRHRMAEIFTSRGCPCLCTFCASHTVHGRSVRYRSIPNIIGEIRFLAERYRVNLFLPEDDFFTAVKKRTLDLAAEIRRLALPDFELQYPNGLSVNSIDDEQIDALVSIGMKIAIFAIESGSEYVQKNIIKKNCNLVKARVLIGRMRERKIRTRCFFILGFPGETKSQMRETIDFARTSGADWSDFFVATPLIGSEMYEQFLAAGVIRDDPEMWRSAFFWQRTFDTPEISAAELNELAYRANLECNFIDNINKRNADYEKAAEIYSDVLAKYPFHMIGLYCLAECREKSGRPDEALEIRRTMDRLYLTDSRSRDMADRYRDLIPGFTPPSAATGG